MEPKDHKGNDAGKGKQAFEYPIVGKSKAVDALVKQISVLAKSRRDVVIVGEGGVGKGAVAKNIYLHGKPAGNDGPFLSVNMSVADDQELEQILFGADRGLQTASGAPKASVLDLLPRGTLLIETLEDASFRNQMKVLAFLRDSLREISDTAANLKEQMLLDTLEDEQKYKYYKDLAEQSYAKMLSATDPEEIRKYALAAMEYLRTAAAVEARGVSAAEEEMVM